MARVRMISDFTFQPPNRGRISVRAGELMTISDEIGDEWIAAGLAQDEAAPWPIIEERRPLLYDGTGGVVCGDPLHVKQRDDLRR